MLEEPGHFAAIPDRAKIVFANPDSEAEDFQTEDVGPCDLWCSRNEESFEVGVRKNERDTVR